MAEKLEQVQELYLTHKKVADRLNGLIRNGEESLSNAGKTKRMALIGTSIIEQQTSGTAYNNNGSITKALAITGWPFELQPVDNFAVGGTTTDVILANQVPAVLASHAINPIELICCSMGGNDTRGGRSLTDIKADVTSIITQLTSVGINMVFELLNPWGTDVSISTSKQANLALNQWFKGLAGIGLIDFVDNTEALLDTTTPYSNALTSLTYDSLTSNLHPNAAGAHLLSFAWVDFFSQFRPLITSGNQAIDVFEKDFNPQGNILTNTTLDGSGAFPDSFSGSGTWTRQDITIPNGQNLNEWSLAVAPSVTNNLYDDYLNSGAWNSTDKIQEGDDIYFICTIELVNVNGLTDVSARLVEFDGSSSIIYLGNQLSGQDNSTPIYDNNLNLKMILKTPICRVRNYSGSGDTNIFTRLNITTDGTGSGEVIISSWEVRKVP